MPVLKEKVANIFQLIRASIKGDESNILEGSIDRAIILLAIPMMLEMVMESLFAIVDIYFVSKIGVNAIAVVGLTESILTIVYALGMGLAMGTTAVVARRVGEKDISGATNSGVQAIYLIIIISLILGVSGYLLSEKLLQVMGTPAEIISEGVGFTKIILGANIVIMMLFLINGIFRGAGDAAIAMRALWISNGINIVLDPVLIFGLGPFPSMGIEGAAIATVIGRSMGVCYQLYHLTSGKGLIKIHKSNLEFKSDIMWKIIKVSGGTTGQFLIGSASWIFLMRIMSRFGASALAGYTVAIRVVIFTLMPAWGISNAAATMVGQNLGAKQPDRAEKSVWRTGLFNMIYMGSVMIIYLAFAKTIINFFTDEANVIEYATKCLVILSLGYLFYAFGMVIVQSFNGSGDTKTPTILNFIFFWMLQIPLAYLLSIHFNFGPTGVFWAIPIAESSLTVISYFIFKKGRWKTVDI